MFVLFLPPLMANRPLEAGEGVRAKQEGNECSTIEDTSWFLAHSNGFSTIARSLPSARSTTDFPGIFPDPGKKVTFLLIFGFWSFFRGFKLAFVRYKFDFWTLVENFEILKFFGGKSSNSIKTLIVVPKYLAPKRGFSFLTSRPPKIRQ